MKLIYLSAPFSTGPDSTIRRQADIDRATAWLTKHTDVYIFSPITYEKPIKDINGVAEKDVEWAFWKPRDGEMVSRCDELWVLCLHNWENSRGVTYEVGEAKRLGKPVHYIQVTFVTETCSECDGSGESGPGWAGQAPCAFCTDGQRGTGKVIYTLDNTLEIA